MRITNVGSGSVTLDLDPGECLLLAHACELAADEHMNTKDGTPAMRGQLYYTTKCYLEALALLADARCHARSLELAEWTLDTTRKNWTVDASKEASK